MALTVADLIARRDEIKKGRKNLYDIETSIGTITVKPPTLKLMDEFSGYGRQNDIELIFETTVAPNLKDKDLQQSYACAVPSDIVPMLFKAGEIGAIARAILKSAGFGINELEIKIHEEIKNS